VAYGRGGRWGGRDRREIIKNQGTGQAPILASILIDPVNRFLENGVNRILFRCLVGSAPAVVQFLGVCQSTQHLPEVMVQRTSKSLSDPQTGSRVPDVILGFLRIG